jgi:hypothetical protein
MFILHFKKIKIEFSDDVKIDENKAFQKTYDLLISNCSSNSAIIIEKDMRSILKKKIVKNFTTKLSTGVSRLFNEKNSFFKHEITNIYSNFFR